MHRLLTGTLPIVLLLAFPIEPIVADDGKKIIEFGWDIPTPEYLVKHATRMEELPFDGVVIDLPLVRGRPLDGNNNSFSMNVFGSKRYELAQFQQDVSDLQSLRLARLTDNFLRLNVSPGNVDWFDDVSAIMHNVRVAAAIVRKAGLKGICFDAEAYKTPLWCYPKLKYRDSKSFVAYAAQVRRRGREFMQAINVELPETTILVLPYTFRPAHQAATARGPLGSWSMAELIEEAGEPVVSYGLLPAFLDGMLEVATKGTVIVDGWECSYGYRFARQFQGARDTIRNICRKYSGVPNKFDQHLQVGFGLWLDYGSKAPPQGWNPSNFRQNYFTPEEFEWSVRHALQHTDRYVWIYSQRLNWWDRIDLPEEYIAALNRARKPAGQRKQPVRSLLARDAGINYFRNHSAKELPGWSDQETFGDLTSKYRELAALPDSWKFQTDVRKVGIDRKWFAIEWDDSKWKTVRIGDWWERSGIDYDGVGWYRVRVNVPRIPAGKRVWLYFGAVDESALVYVNGRKAGEHDEGFDGWDRRFGFDITSLAHSDSANLIAVRVLDRAYGGGIWKSVKLFVER